MKTVSVKSIVEEDEETQSEKSPNLFVLFSGLTVQLGTTMYITSEFGKYLDLKFNTGKTLTALSLITMLCINIYLVVKISNRYNSR